MNITKLELCNRVSKKFEKPAGDLKPVFEAFLDEIMEVLSEGQRIEIRGFGCFKTKNRKFRIGRNPRTGETVHIPEYMAPVFKFSRDAQKIFDKKAGVKTKETPSTPTKSVRADTPPVMVTKAAETFAP